MLGPGAVTLATRLGKELGLSAAKASQLLGEQFGISITPGGVVGAIARQARALEPTYAALVWGVRASAVVAPDETGWRVEGSKAWAVGVRRRGRHRLPDRGGARLRAGRRGSGRGVQRRSGARRLGALPALRPGLPSELPCPPAVPRPGDDRRLGGEASVVAHLERGLETECGGDPPEAFGGIIRCPRGQFAADFPPGLLDRAQRVGPAGVARASQRARSVYPLGRSPPGCASVARCSTIQAKMRARVVWERTSPLSGRSMACSFAQRRCEKKRDLDPRRAAPRGRCSGSRV